MIKRRVVDERNETVLISCSTGGVEPGRRAPRSAPTRPWAHHHPGGPSSSEGQVGRQAQPHARPARRSPSTNEITTVNTNSKYHH